MGLPIENLPRLQNTPLRKAVRRLRWFSDAFSKQVAAISGETGIRFEIDRHKLRAVFLAWVKRFEAQKPSDPEHKKAYITFAAAMMLKELIAGSPLSATRVPETLGAETPEAVWPEGYAYIIFCMTVRAAVIGQELDLEADPGPLFSDIDTWWSFKENARDDIGSIMGFFELFVGEEPNWSMPEVFHPDHAEQNFLKLFGTDTAGTARPGQDT